MAHCDANVCFCHEWLSDVGAGGNLAHPTFQTWIRLCTVERNSAPGFDIKWFKVWVIVSFRHWSNQKPANQNQVLELTVLELSNKPREAVGYGVFYNDWEAWWVTSYNMATWKIILYISFHSITKQKKAGSGCRCVWHQPVTLLNGE